MASLRSEQLAATRVSMLSGYAGLDPAWQWTHDDGSDARVYEARGRVFLIAFAGQSGKPALHYSYRDVFAAMTRGIEFIKGRKAHGAFVANRRAAQSAFKTTLTVGRVLMSSWGYDQTNIDYYQVTRVIGPQTVEIRPIAQKAVDDGAAAWSGHCWPLADHFTGEPMVKRVRQGDYVMLTSYSSAAPWEPKPNYWSAYA